MPDMLTAFALISIALTVSALVSKAVERAPLSFPILFLSLGWLLGDRGLGYISIAPDDGSLEVVAVLSLAFVLFLDAVKMRLNEIRREWFVPVLVLGPGSMMTIGAVALAAWALIGTTLVESLLLGAILASTDAVVLRDVVRDSRIPGSIRRALSVEAGVNDIVVLPIILILIAVEKGGTDGVLGWSKFAGQLFVLGPLVGIAVGGIGSSLMEHLDARVGIRREYQALYGVGLVLAAFVSGESVGGDGFLAAFAAGLAVVLFNRQLCDCFLEYGDVTAEMAMLLAFVLFGAALSTLVDDVEVIPALALAAVAIGLIRPLATGLALRRANISRGARIFIGWFGPRGLNSLLLALLVVRAGLPEGEELLGITGIVVMASVAIHGMTATPLSAWYSRKVEHETLAEERQSTAGGLFRGVEEVPRISVAELTRQLEGPSSPLVLDVRSRSQYAQDPTGIPGSVRVPPDQVAEWAGKQAISGSVVTYCA
ncbi:MAG: cation:proton antiporter [Dehalococcoidia bacterium]|nr:MAG: cation:proton antiporter [Dehalococcoidia bacterium]